MKGIVVKSTGSWYSVRMDSGEVMECRIKGKFRMKGIKTTNPVAVGDVVEVEMNPDGAVINRIEDRKNYIIRKSTNLSKEAHIIAANVDQAVLVVTVNHPVTSIVFIDRLMLLGALTRIYEQVGYTWLHASSLTGEGMEDVVAALKDKVTVFSGLSGVGKSSLINRVEPGLNLKVAEISDSHDTGKHTTTFAEMFPLSFGGSIIDTPGIRAFGLIHMEKTEISHYFPEIFKRAEDCRFYNCTHIHEPGCAVIQAVEDGEISESRYFSYVNMFEEGDEKYRK